MASEIIENQSSKLSKECASLALAEKDTGKYLGRIHRPKGFSSRRRIKPEKGTACYHVMSRTVNGEFLFGPTEKEAFRRMMWKMSRFAGVEVFTYVVMGNHFHILVKVPDQKKWLKRFEAGVGEDASAGEERLLNHLSTVYSEAFLKQLRKELRTLRENGMEEEAQKLLGRFKRRFCDVSLFVKELKERFSRWFNQQTGRRGTLWMDRFKSVCVEGEAALATIAAYIDLNPVRAGIVDDPMSYEWSGYGEASAGSKRARRGLCKALNLPQDSWESRGLPRYRLFLFDEGLSVESGSSSLGQGKRRRRGVSMEARTKVMEQQGEVSPAQVLRERISSFTNGVAVGSEPFVRKVALGYQLEFQRKKERVPQESPGIGGFFVMRQ
jgi:REP element-mobilizing transposase RayT